MLRHGAEQSPGPQPPGLPARPAPHQKGPRSSRTATPPARPGVRDVQLDSTDQHWEGDTPAHEARSVDRVLPRTWDKTEAPGSRSETLRESPRDLEGVVGVVPVLRDQRIEHFEQVALHLDTQKSGLLS